MTQLMSHTDKCLFRLYDNPALCSPMNPAYIAIHGMDGNGGRQASAGIPVDYRGVLLADSPVRSDQVETYRKLEAYTKSFEKQFDDVQAKLLAEGQTENEVRVKSLYLWSESPGTGKTTTAVALLNQYLLANFIGNLRRKETPPQRPVYFLDANQLQTEYSSFNRPRVPEDIAEPASRRYYSAIEYGKHTDFVVIDDIGMRGATEGFRSDLHSVINHRVSNRMPTIYTSNIPIDNLEEVFGEKRLGDRVRDMCLEIHFGGTSKRGAR